MGERALAENFPRGLGVDCWWSGGVAEATIAAAINALLRSPQAGGLFRAAILEQTEVGRQVEPILASGELVPDELTIALIRDRLSKDDAALGFVLDGFPRNLAQAEALEAYREAYYTPGESAGSVYMWDDGAPGAGLIAGIGGAEQGDRFALTGAGEREVRAALAGAGEQVEQRRVGESLGPLHVGGDAGLRERGGRDR